MLKSLFGELRFGSTGTASPEDFKPVHLQESSQRVAEASGRLIDRSHQELWIQGSPASAIRDHLTQAARGDQVRVITLLDPTKLWAPLVIRALADATGQGTQRLHIRDEATEATLVTLERTVIPRRGDISLKLYHADVPATDGSRSDASDDSHLTPYVVMENSDMAAVIVGSMTRPQVDEMLARLATATRSPSWRCPTLVFMLPPALAWPLDSVQGVTWPSGVRIEVIDEPLTAASGVWNTLLSAWDRHERSLTPAMPERDEASEAARAVARQLRQLMETAGFVGCAVAEVQTGQLIAGESHDAQVDLARAAAALAPCLRAQQHALAGMGCELPTEEIVVCAGQDQYVIRPLAARPNLFVFARLHRAYANLTLARLKIAEAERNLG